jgi:hypothetical protein
MSRLNFDEELTAVGSSLSRDDFLELVATLHNGMHASWTVDELLCHPTHALLYCDAVRAQAGNLPEDVILKALLRCRKSIE